MKNAAKKDLRRRQRQINAKNSSQLYKEISTAHTENKVIFYKLINKQRQTGRERLNELVVNGERLSEPDKIRQGWVDYLRH